MLNFFRKKENLNNDIRDVLFGDKPISEWCNGSEIPWVLFRKAKDEIDIGDNKKAIHTLEEIIELEGLESRHYLQAWYFLKKLGVLPNDLESKNVYGIVIEVALKSGLDILAAYADHSARYFNYSGAAIIWEKPDNSLDYLIEKLISLSQEVVSKIGPWNQERPKPPIEGNARLNFLTPIGLHFGEGPLSLLSKDQLGGPVIMTATELMQAMTQKSIELKKR